MRDIVGLEEEPPTRQAGKDRTMRIAFTSLAGNPASQDLDGIVRSGSRRAVASACLKATEGEEPPELVDLVAGGTLPDRDLPDVIVALIDSVAETVLPAWIARASHIPLIGLLTSRTIEDDLSTISLHWDEVVTIDDRERLVYAIRRALRRVARTRQANRAVSRLREVIDLVPHLTFSYDGDTRLLLANRAMANAFGKPVARIEGQRFVDLEADPAEMECLASKFGSVIWQGRPVDNEVVDLTYHDGTVHLLNVSLRPIPGPDSAVLGVAVDITEQRKAEAEIQQAVRDLNRLLSATVDALSLSVEERDPYTAGHQTRVAQLAVAIAEELALDPERIIGVRIGASLHDIGKLAIPSEILAKPGRLSHEEYQLVRTHAGCGHKIIANVPFPWPVGDMVLHHHERLDGSGYPDGLSGPDISLESRILAVCDVYEAMANHRPYRAALGAERASAQIREGRGTQFDSDVVDALGRVTARSDLFAESWGKTAGDGVASRLLRDQILEARQQRKQAK
jgi:PAS domain S-box-containing protein